MSLRWFYRPDWIAGHPAVEFTDFVRLYTTDVTEHAEEGSVAASTILVDDPLAALDFPPLTSLYATETANSATSNTYVYHGYIAERAVHRGDSALTGSARVWEVSVVDENSLLSRRVLSSANANRPSESDVTRMLWLANLADGQQLIDDTSMVSTANAVLMDANDYRGQTALDVANDCAEAGRKNFWLRFNENVNGAALWYGKGSVTTDTSMVRLSNDLADIDNLTTFAISADTVLNRSPSRLVSSVYYQYANGAVYVRNQTMIPRIGLRDAPMSSTNVKTLARATSRADGILADLDTEEDRITTSVRLPAAKVNWIRAGMRLQFKATHLPEYESFVWLRVYRRSVAQDSEESYLLTLELGSDDIPATPVPDTSPASGVLYQPTGDGGTGSFGIEPEVRWGGTGDSPPGGYPTVPLQGSLEYVSDGLVPTYSYKGFRALGSGTLTVTFRADDIAGVVGTVTCTPAIAVNGAVVASSPHTTTDAAAPGFPYSHGNIWDFSTSISVSSGDVISAQFTSSWGDMKVPGGTGDPSHKLLVSGDLT